MPWNALNTIKNKKPAGGATVNWVAVGEGALIAKSTDGNIWSPAASSGELTNRGVGVAYGTDGTGAGLWVAVGAGSLITKSPDGTNWIPAATVSGVSGKGGITGYGWGVAYGKDGTGAGLWVAVGEGGIIAKSTDGTNWTPAASSGGITSQGRGVAYGKDNLGNGLWVAVGDGEIIAKSTNGNVWTPAATSADGSKGGITGYGFGVAYGKDGAGAGLWVAVGNGGLIAKSTDGNIWTPAGNVGGITSQGRAVAYGNGLWVVVGGGKSIAKSTDGNIWTPAASTGGVGFANGVAFKNDNLDV